jgi:NADPH:quinone reductase-like Zn-dependent oxidoreductase
VDFVAAGIHHVTRSVATGRHYGSGDSFPVIPGLNAVARTAAGELVFTSGGPPPYGTFAERIAAPGAMRFPLPAGASPEAVAAGINPGLASWLPPQARRAQAGPLGTVLILGVTGMSGFLAAQNARLLGAKRVIGAGRDPAGLARAAAAGAAAVAEAAFAGRGRRGLSEDTASIRYVQIGALAGAEAAVPAALLRSRKVTISGSGAGSVAAADIQAQIPAYLQLIADGSVQVPYRTFPLWQAGAAWTASAQAGPRVVLVRD